MTWRGFTARIQSLKSATGDALAARLFRRRVRGPIAAAHSKAALAFAHYLR
jgi:hypothetical protein